MSVEVQWTDTDPETGERRYVAASRFGRQWAFQIRFHRRDDWADADETQITRDMWETLLEALERRYQRREGVSESDLLQVQRILARFPVKPELDGDQLPPREA